MAQTPVAMDPAGSGRIEHVSSLRGPILFFLAVAAGLFLVVWIGNSVFPEAAEDPGSPVTPLEPVLGGWTRYDAGWYVGISDNGYKYVPGAQSEVAFFPAYPLAMRAVSYVTGSSATAGMLITFASGLGVAVLWWMWLKLKLSPSARKLSFALLLLWPYAWYLYGAVYADALFLVATLGAFVLLEKQRPVSAGLAAAVATAARPFGIAVVVGLVAWVVERRLRDTSGRGFRLTDAGVLLGLLGIGGWCLFLWNRFGDPLAFLSAQEGWGQDPGPATWFKLTFLDMLNEGRPGVIRLLPHAVATLVFLGLVPAVVRRFGWGYGLYTLAVVGIPFVGSSTFQGLGRYLLAAFPVFALIGEWLVSRPRLATAAIIISALGLVIGAGLYSMGWYIA